MGTSEEIYSYDYIKPPKHAGIHIYIYIFGKGTTREGSFELSYIVTLKHHSYRKIFRILGGITPK